MDVVDSKKNFKSSSIICRFCLTHESTCNVIETLVDEEFVEILRNLMGISISLKDNWPKSLCTFCLNKINDFRALLITVRENECRLREVYGEYHLQDDEKKDIPLHDEIAVFASKEEDIKEELHHDPIKEENDSSSDVDLKDDEEEEHEDIRKRVLRSSKRTLKISLKRPKKRKASVHDESVEDDLEEIPDEIEDNTQGKKAKVVVNEEIDADIHTFFKMECELCQVLFSRFADLQKHFRKQHKRRGYVVCCGKKLNSPKKLQVHMNNHKNPPKYECTLCQKNYKSEDTLLMHKKLQHTPVEERKFCCDKCPRRFALGGALRRHMIVHVANEDKKHVCTTCGQAFAVANILANHIRRVHENACISVCDICAKVYRHKYLFEKHMMEHRNELKPNVPCPVCGRLFTYRLAMQRHLRRHNTSGSLECHICRHVSANQQALREHIKLNHMERKLFECSLCERIFRTRKALKEHMASHTGQVLYECSYCSKQFNNNANYYSHKKNVHPVEWQLEREKRLAQQIFLKPESKTD